MQDSERRLSPFGGLSEEAWLQEVGSTWKLITIDRTFIEIRPRRRALSDDCAPGVVELYGFEVAAEGAFRANSLLWHARSLARGDLVGNRRRGERALQLYAIEILTDSIL